MHGWSCVQGSEWCVPLVALLHTWVSEDQYRVNPLQRCYLSHIHWALIIIIIIIIIILVITIMQGIYNYIHETDSVSSVYTAAAVLYLQFVLHVMLFRPWSMFCTVTLALPAVYVCSAHYTCFLQSLNFTLSWYVAQVLSDDYYYYYYYGGVKRLLSLWFPSSARLSFC